MYKCHVGYDFDNIVAVKIVKMEPQYTETQEVRFSTVVCVEGVSLLSTCPVLFKQSDVKRQEYFSNVWKKLLCT